MNRVAIQGICYDEKSSFLKGARRAPALIRQALNDGSMNLYSEKGITIQELDLSDKGDFQIENYADIRKVTNNSLKDCDRILSLGGDHSVTYPILQAVCEKFGPVDILHIDAHGDLYDTFDGDPYSHACPFARIMEDGLASRLVQVGIRTLNPHQRAQAQKYDVEIHEMWNLDLSRIVRFDNPLYISLDIDGFDPAYAPGVSHHEPGGLTPRQVLNLIHHLDARLIGADMVEYNPQRDIHNMTAYLCAKMMKELLVRMGS